MRTSCEEAQVAVHIEKRRADCINQRKKQKLRNYKSGEKNSDSFRETTWSCSGYRVTLQPDTGVSMTEISGLIDMLLKRMVVVVIVMMIVMMTMIVMVIRVMVIVTVMVIREIIVGRWLAIRVPGSR